MTKKEKLPKIPYDLKQLFQHYDVRFIDEVESIVHELDDELTKEERMQMILKHGEYLDKKLYRSKGIKRETYGRLPYKERARRYVEKMKKGKVKKSKQERIDSMVKAGGIVTEERLPYIIFGLGGVVKDYEIKSISRRVNDKKVFTSDTLDILDAVAHKLYISYIKEIKETEVSKELNIRTIEEFTLFEEHFSKKCFIKRPDKRMNIIIISDEEIRKFIGKSRYSGDQIRERTKNLGRITLEGTLPIFFGKDGWTNVSVTGGFAEVWVASEKEEYFRFRSKRKLRGEGKGREENVYIVRFIGSWGTAYLFNVLNRRVTIFPPRFYRQLSANAKMLFRAICGKPVSIINIHQISKILDWEEEVVNISKRVIAIEKLWAELRQEGFINKPKKYEREGVIFWRVERRKDWFNLPKQLEKVKNAH